MANFRTNDGVELSYTDEGKGRAVVLIHGYTAPATAWALTTDALLEAGYRVITFDRRSHGESATPAYGQRMARHGRDIGELLDHLELDRATLVGASMGGNAIWAYVDQFGSARLDGVVIVDQTPKMLNTPDWSHGFFGYARPTPLPCSPTASRRPAGDGRWRSPARRSPGCSNGSAVRRPSAIRPLRKRSPCCSITPCRIGVTSSLDSIVRC